MKPDISAIPNIGTMVELTMNDIFGNPYTVAGKVVKEPYQHGYILPSGAWALYGHKGDTPCYKFGFVLKGKRKTFILKVNNIVSLRKLDGDK